MDAHAVISSTGHRRIHIARGWLENRAAAEEVLIVGATLDAANELARKVAEKKGAAFGWHRLTLPQLAFAIDAPILAACGLTPLSRIGVGALVARLVHRMNAERRLSRYQSVAPLTRLVSCLATRCCPPRRRQWRDDDRVRNEAEFVFVDFARCGGDRGAGYSADCGPTNFAPPSRSSPCANRGS